MAVFNRTFYDLNRERGWCVDGAAGFPQATIADLKLAVPGDVEHLEIRGLFLMGDSVRLTVVAVTESGTDVPAAQFGSDARTMLRVGEPYDLAAVAEGYGGLVVFGEGLHTDFRSDRSFRVSEECLTRYRPGTIPWAGLTCDSVRLTGEVLLAGGDPTRLVSEGVDLDRAEYRFFPADRGLRLTLVDTGVASPDNPMIAMANGINSYFGRDGGRGPVYQLFGARPDETGTVYVRFDAPFHFAAVSDDLSDPERPVSALAIGTDLTLEDVCRSFREPAGPDEPEAEPCHSSDISFEVIRYD